MATSNTTNIKNATAASPVDGLTWEEFNLLKKYLPLYDSSSNVERLKWITYINKTRTRKDDTQSVAAASRSFNSTAVQAAYDKLSQYEKDTGSTDFYIANSLRKLQHINSLQTIIAKTAIGVDGFFAQGTDRVGSTVVGVLNAVDDAASFALDSINRASAKLKKYTQEYNSREPNTKVEDNADANLKGNSATRSIFATAGNAFNDGWADLNKKMKQNRIANIPGDMFASARTLLFTVRQELEQAIDAINQIFQNIHIALIKLQRKIKSIITALVTLLMTALDFIIEIFSLDTFFKEIASSIGESLKEVGERIRETINNFFGDDIMINLFADLNKELQSFATGPDGLFAFLWKNVSSGMSIDIIPGASNLSQVLNSFEQSITNPLQQTLYVARQYSNINWLLSQLNSDTRKTLGIIQAMATNAKGFIGSGIRSTFIKYALKNKTTLFAGDTKKKVGIQFTFAQPQYFGTTQFQYNPSINPIVVLPRLAIDGSSINVDRSGNKVNYSAYTNMNLF